jgi:tetratricopeptide (TPR) repeat protein
MKRLMTCVFSLTIVTLVFSLSACNSNEKTAAAAKTLDIPATSKSAEAKEAFEKGLQLADESTIQKARAMFAKATELDPNMAIGYLFRANYAQSPKEFMDNLEKAKAHLDGASEWEKLYYEFQNTFATNDWNKRLEVMKKIVAAYPDAARAQVDLGNTYQAGNQPENERAAYKKAIELNPKWVGGYSALSASYLFSEPKDFKKAEENALKAVELTPKNSNAQVALGDAYRAEDDLEKAKASYAKAIELNPDQPTAYYKRGHVNSFLGKYDEARSDYKDATKYDDSNTGANEYIAYTYLYAGDTKTALQSFSDEAAKLDASGQSKSKIASDKLNYMFDCAYTCLQQGDATKLREVATMMQGPWDQVSTDVGTQEEKLLQKASNIYWNALADVIEGKLDDARAKAEEHKKTLEPVKSPTKGQDYEMILGRISMKEKKYSDAITHFEKANPNSVYTKYCQAVANEAAGNKEKAMQLYKEVSVYNFNGVEYAIIRNEVKQILASQVK